MRGRGLGENSGCFIDASRATRVQRVELVVGGIEPIGRRERQAPRVVPRRPQQRVERRRLRLLQHLVPAAESRQRVVGHHTESRGERQRLQRLVIDLRRQLARRLNRQPALPVDRRRKPEEVDVVRVVGHRIEALRAALRDVVLVGGNRQLVALIASA